MSSFLELARKRWSVRSFRPDGVPRDAMLRCLEAARLAPSACNSQPWRFVVVDDPELKRKVADETSDRLLPLNHFTKQAPVHVVVVMEPAKWRARVGAALTGRDFAWMDVGIAAEHFCLQAAEEGLGTCMLGWFHEKPIKHLLGVPASRRIALVIVVGYPVSTEIPEKVRKPLHNEVASWGRYGQDSALAEA
jgi:nitroreductase